jgi:ABC-type multidrug transport system fused ATPase/permease subunit
VFSGKNIQPYPPFLGLVPSVKRFRERQAELREKYKNSDLHLILAVIQAMWPQLSWVIIYKCIEEGTSVISPILFKSYFKLLTSDGGNIQKAIIIILASSGLTFLRSQAGQHSNRLLG